MKLKVFLFHRVSPDADLVWPPITPLHFDRIISHLQKDHEIVPLEQTILGNYKPSGKKKLCAITFDDGYKDFITHALPVLKKHKAPASMYVITESVNSGMPPWTFVLHHTLLGTKHEKLELKSEEIPTVLRKIKWNDTKEKVHYIKKLSHQLKRISNQGREEVLGQIMAQTTDVRDWQTLMMNWDDIRNIHQEGIEIGSHSESHPTLSGNLDLEHLYDELKKSGAEIQQYIDKFPLAISYPFGMYNNDVKNLAEKAGYKMGLTVLPKKHGIKTNRFEIPRIELYSEPFWKSKLRLGGQIQLVKNVLFYDSNSINKALG